MVQLNQLFGQRQSDASAFELAGVRIVYLNKSIENMRQAVFRDADAGVLDGDLDNTPRPAARDTLLRRAQDRLLKGGFL